MAHNEARVFRKRLANGPLVADGALGTILLASAPTRQTCLEVLNLERPALVRDIHRAYREAGAEILQTNTFGANRFRLTAAGREERLADINRAAVELAREAAGNEVLVAGSVGPSGLFRPGDAPPITAAGQQDLYQAFREQIETLVAAGIDLIVLETFYVRGEILAALRASRAVSATVPIVAQAAVNERGEPRDGSSWAQWCVELEQNGADVIGCNCSRGPGDLLLAVRQLASRTRLPLSAQPSAGLPDERRCYPYDPESFAAGIGALLGAGASLVGGCCGSTPAHIEKLCAVVAEYRHEFTGRVLAPFSRPATAIRL